MVRDGRLQAPCFNSGSTRYGKRIRDGAQREQSKIWQTAGSAAQNTAKKKLNSESAAAQKSIIN